MKITAVSESGLMYLPPAAYYPSKLEFAQALRNKKPSNVARFLYEEAFFFPLIRSLHSY